MLIGLLISLQASHHARLATDRQTDCHRLKLPSHYNSVGFSVLFCVAYKSSSK